VTRQVEFGLNGRTDNERKTATKTQYILINYE